MKRNVTEIYWENRIKTASPIELVIIAYEAAISSLEAAKGKIRGKKVLDAGLLIIKAQKIIRELRNSLDMDIKEISGNLFLLYRTMDLQLIEAGRQKDEKAIEGVIHMLSELRDAWSSVAKTAPARAAAGADSPAFVNAYK